MPTRLLLALALALSSLAAEESWTGLLTDAMCARQDQSVHPVSCMIGCAKGGFGLVLENGRFLKFDPAGNEKALAALKATSKEKQVEATVKGSLAGETIAVTALELK
ncbi:MAG: hypothetical protein FJW37_07685 [Acidobacteria bacterium]|nr:hypothetical protein [Acidobacteriota bacterium]